MVGIFTGQHLSQEAWPWQSSINRLRRLGGSYDVLFGQCLPAFGQWLPTGIGQLLVPNDVEA